MMKVEGQQVERRRRENRGEEEGGVWGGVSPHPMGEGSGEGAVPPAQKFFKIFFLDLLHFGCNLMHFQT